MIFVTDISCHTVLGACNYHFEFAVVSANHCQAYVGLDSRTLSACRRNYLVSVQRLVALFGPKISNSFEVADCELVGTI